MSGVLNVCAELDPGSIALAVVVPAVTVPPEEEVTITDFGASAKDTGTTANTNSYFRLETSGDGFVSDVKKASIIEIVQGGTVLKSLERPIVLGPGQSFRVLGKQDVVTRMSAELFGGTKFNDIVQG
jgi:hypothetical protein